MRVTVSDLARGIFSRSSCALALSIAGSVFRSDAGTSFTLEGRNGPTMSRPTRRLSYSSATMRYTAPEKHGCTTSPLSPGSRLFTDPTVAAHALRPSFVVFTRAHSSCSRAASASIAPSVE